MATPRADGGEAKNPPPERLVPWRIERRFSDWLDGLRGSRGDSAQALWERYFHRVVSLSRTRLPRHLKRDFDEEDVAISALNSLFEGVKADRFPEVDDRDDLWKLLAVITARKISHRLRRRCAQRRGGDAVRGESVFGGDDSRTGIAGLGGDGPTPAFAAEVADEAARLLALLEDPELRRLALLKVNGLSHAEIARELGCGLRTVERRLELVRRLWAHAVEARGCA